MNLEDRKSLLISDINQALIDAEYHETTATKSIQITDTELIYHIEVERVKIDHRIHFADIEHIKSDACEFFNTYVCSSGNEFIIECESDISQKIKDLIRVCKNQRINQLVEYLNDQLYICLIDSQEYSGEIELTDSEIVYTEQCVNYNLVNYIDFKAIKKLHRHTISEDYLCISTEREAIKTEHIEDNHRVIDTSYRDTIRIEFQSDMLVKFHELVKLLKAD